MDQGGMLVMETPNNAKLFAKIAAIMGEVRTLEKTGRNQFDKYDYVTADAIAIKLGAIMAKHKVVLLPSMVSAETSEYQTKSGGSNFRTVVNMQMTLACGDTGATFTSLWSGEAIDRSDKSISKAATSAEKYFLLKTFLLAGGDEEDADAESPVVDAPQRAQATPASKQTRNAPTTPQDASTPTSKPRATHEQVHDLDTLGVKFYGGKQWPAERTRLSKAASKGAVQQPTELMESEIAKLIKGLTDEIAKAEQQPEASLANADPIPH